MSHARHAHAPIAARLALTSLSVVISLVALELILRTWLPARDVGPAFTTHDPVYGKALKKSHRVRRVTPEFTMTLTTNSLGFRGPEPARFPTRGVLFLGDSFTMGYGVDDGFEFPALVARTLDARFGPGRVPVVNAGLGNTGNGRWLKFLRRDAPRFAPRAVVFQLCSNDPDDNAVEGLFRLTDAGGLVEMAQASEPSWQRRAQQWVEAVPGLADLHLLGMLRMDRRAPAGGSPSADVGAPSPGERLTLRLLDEALALSAAHGWTALVVAADLDARFAERVARAIAPRGLTLLRMPTKRERPDLYYRVDGHWTARGHALAARKVTDELLARGVLTAPERMPAQPAL